MDTMRFSVVTRSLTGLPSRRDVLRGLSGAGFGLGATRFPALTNARKKRRRKKKRKKCKGGTKTCGKTCIPATSCCSSSDCGDGATCVNGACICSSGFKSCNGECIATLQCCEACPGDQVCDNGTCACPSGFKNCDGKCITVLQCCEACPGGQVCDTGDCVCPSGFKACDGKCIPTLECCEACPGEKVCNKGECACLANAEFECPGDRCFRNPECCETEECSGDLVCVDGICLCPGADAINCGELCCDGNTEVCKFEEVGDDVVPSCQAGGCPATNFCADAATEQFACALDVERVCVCTTTVDLIPVKVCVDLFSLGDESCEECDSSTQCGTGRVCIADGPLCNCGVNFCVDLCPEVASNRARHGAGGTPVDLEVLKDATRKRRRSTR